MKLFNHKKYGFTHFKLLSSQIAPVYRPSQRERKLAARGSHICKYLYRRNGKEMFTLIQKERIMHLFTTSQTIFPSDMTSRVRQDISHNCILCMCNNSQINKSHCSSNNIFTYSITSGNEA